MLKFQDHDRTWDARPINSTLVAPAFRSQALRYESVGWLQVGSIFREFHDELAVSVYGSHQRFADPPPPLCFVSVWRKGFMKVFKRSSAKPSLTRSNSVASANAFSLLLLNRVTVVKVIANALCRARSDLTVFVSLISIF